MSIDLDDLRAKAEGATAGPWFQSGDDAVSTGDRVVEEVPGEWDGRGCP